MDTTTITFKAGFASKSLQIIKAIRDWATPSMTLMEAKGLFHSAIYGMAPITIHVKRDQAGDAMQAFTDLDCTIVATSLDTKDRTEDFKILNTVLSTIGDSALKRGALEALARIETHYRSLLKSAPLDDRRSISEVLADSGPD